ncbi:MAG: PD-(D/E)XK nuclease family protein [Elusimicrobia bacterium]|nr:PD-(D/E)XK nuclease family protein [Elusimicrobiota bacterium]
MELSFTQFRIYLECPWKYKLMFVEGLRIAPTPDSSLGQSLHRALECYHRGGRGTLEALLDCYDRCWVGAGFSNQEQSRRCHEKGLRMLEKYFERDRDRRSKVVASEKEFSYPLGRHVIRGMPDRLDRHPDGRYELIDYKTRLDFEPHGRVDETLQLRFYALGLVECLALTPAWISLYSLAGAEKRTWDYDPAGEEELKAMILSAADSIEKGIYAPDVSFCRRCQFRLTCAHSTAKQV